mmetsp:Transcript_1244/g.2249  ORF Transcript_1244/g.2249 Transcript_1244/m.2249 type:complete len:894 (+) Transcript_1244:323-3004(+)
MPLATRSTNQILQRKKSVGSPAVAMPKKRTKKTATGAASSKKSPAGVYSTKTILHYFSPSSQASQNSSTPKKDKENTVQSLSLEPPSPVPFSNISCNSDRLSQDEVTVLSYSQESKVVEDTQQLVKSVDQYNKNSSRVVHMSLNSSVDTKTNGQNNNDHKRSRQRNSRTCSIKSSDDGNGADVKESIADEAECANQKTVNHIIKIDVDVDVDVAPKEKTPTLIGKKRPISNDPTCEVNCLPEECDTNIISIIESTSCHVPQKPKIGDLVRMLFKQRDLFVEECKVWSIGTIVSVSQVGDSSFKMKVQWSDKIEEEYDYPNNDLEILTPKENSDSLVYTSSLSSKNDSIAFDPNPGQLQLGDHVQCLYQNGLSNGQWWPARVAKIDEKENLVDVAYFDGEYEIGIPLKENKINFIESGIDSLAKWFVGADITVATHAKSKGRKGKSKVVMTFNECDGALGAVHSVHDIKVLVQTQRGGLAEKSFVYTFTRMISSLYKKKLQDRKVLLWPTYNTANPSQLRKRMKRTQDVNTDNAQTTELIESGDALDLQELQIEDDSDVDDDFFQTSGPRLSEMPSSLGNACWRNLHSSEPQNGYYILHHVLSSWKYMPNENLNHLFSTFLLDGPLNDDVQIVEPYRTELTFLYLEQVLKTQCANEHSCWSSSIRCMDFEKLLDFPSNETNSQLNITSYYDSDMSMLAKQLQFHSMTLQFSAQCVTEELRLLISAKIKASTETLLKKPFTSCILRKGTRDCLKMFVRTYVRFMSKHGHWLIRTLDMNAHSSSTTYEQLCAYEVERYVKALGTLISYTAWLFSAREDLPLDDFSCCSLIRDTFENEFNNLDLYSNRSKKKLKEKLKKDMQLQFIFALETFFSREFQKEISKMFSLSKEFELVMSA